MRLIISFPFNQSNYRLNLVKMIQYRYGLLESIFKNDVFTSCNSFTIVLTTKLKIYGLVIKSPKISAMHFYLISLEIYSYNFP